MGIQAEITRIENAKTSISQAIAAKGVTVPIDTKIDGMAALIANIQGGGSSGFSGTPIAGDTPVIVNNEMKTCVTTTITATGLSIRITRTGTYRIKFLAYNTYSSAQAWGTNFTVQIYKNNVSVGNTTTLQPNIPTAIAIEISCEVGDTIEVYAINPAGIAANPVIVSGLMACIEWENGF